MTIFSIPRAFSLLAALALASPALAQQAPATAPANMATPVPSNTSRALVYRAAPPEQRADKMSQQLSRQLSLDAATTAKVRAAALVRDQKIDAIQNGTDSNKAKNTALQANAQEFKAALQTILTPAQYAQYTSHSGKHSQTKTAPAQPATTPAN